MNEWWRGAVIYQIYPRSFQDSDGNGIGDLKGIIDRLPHVARLGADAIWLSPFFTSPMDDMGYDVADYRDVDPLFGSLEEFDRLVETAHDLGLKVIIDQVLSHSSDRHEWFEASRQSRDNDKADWYVWADPNRDGTPPNNWPSVFGGPAWEWEPRRRQYYLHNFLISQPDLNFHNREVQDATLDNVRFWLERGVDGFRLDTVNYYFHDKKLRDNPPAEYEDDQPPSDTYGMQNHTRAKNQPENLAFLERLRALTDEYDDRMMVGEVGDAGETGLEIMSAYTKGNSRLHMAYSFEMLSPRFTAKHFRTVIEGFFDAAPDGWPSWSFSNHDVPRHVSRWSDASVSDDAIARQTAAMLMSFEGSIGIYQGEELGQLETEMERHELTDPPAIRFWPEIKGRDGCRTPMVWDGEADAGGFTTGEPWLPVKPPQLAHAVAQQEAANDSILAAYCDVIAFRKGSTVLMRGKTAFLDLPEPILAFTRSTDDETLLCVFNLSKGPHSLELSATATPEEPHAAELDGTRLTLPPNGYVYLSGPADITASLND